ncbi:MAG: hypothetical protein GYB64_17695, partial [Chloroflexi bacterium]|nr:hypothetical protein [Chloroflexota bacterium]
MQRAVIIAAMAQTKTPTTQPKPGRTELIAGPLLILLLVGLGLAFIDRRPDRAFITYRYAQNLAAGHGFVYNTGDPHLVSGVSPLYAALLAAIDPADLPLFGSLLGAAGIALGSAALLAMPSDAKGRPVGAGAAAIMLAFPLLWLTLGLETALWIGLCLAGIALYLRGVPWGTALILALATVLHPETLILAGVLVAAAIVEGRPFDVVPVSLYTVGVLAGLIWALNTFDNPLAFLQIDPTDTLAPNAWVGLGAFFAALFDLSLLWLVLPMLAVPGVLHVHAHPWALVVVGWGLLHVAVLAILFVPVYPWSFAPLVPTFAVMAALGVAWIGQRIPAEQPRWIAVVLAVLLIGGAAGESVVTVLTTSAGRGTDWLALAPAPVLARDREVGAWLQENTPPSAVIGLSTADSLGTGAL